MVALNQVVDIRGGGTPSKAVSEYWGGAIPWASVKDFKSTVLKSTKDYITELGVKNSATNIIPANSIVVPTRMAVGKVALTAVDMAINQDIKALIIKDEEVLNRRFLLRFLESQSSNILKHAKGATVKGITLDVLRELEIPLPPLTEQKRIAAILDKADAIRRKRQQAIQLADEFLRSVFLDMFGDPVTNPRGWKTTRLGEITEKIGSGSTPRGGKTAYLNEGISLIRSLNVHDNRFVHKGLAFISEEQAEKLKHVVVKKDDILLNITGASVCRTALVDHEILPARVNQHVCIVRTDRTFIEPVFLTRLLTCNSIKQTLMRIATSGGATREALTKKQVEDFEVILPPVSFQLEFVRIVKIADTIFSKTNYQTKQPLFNSIIAKAFSADFERK